MTANIMACFGASLPDGFYYTEADYDALAAERDVLAKHPTMLGLGRRVAALERALRLIAEQTVCPELFPDETDSDRLCVKTAMTIAIAALEQQSETEAKS